MGEAAALLGRCYAAADRYTLAVDQIQTSVRVLTTLYPSDRCLPVYLPPRFAAPGHALIRL